jgi:RHS repeat-associated protein
MILAQFRQTYGTGQSLTLVYPDDHGSSRVTVSSVGSTIQDKYSYDAWGKCTHTSGSDGSLSNFTGKFYDDTGFLYFNSRYFDPVTGRFITEDPSRQGVNWYAYCRNNPVNMTDPDGRDPPQYKDWKGTGDTLLHPGVKSPSNPSSPISPLTESQQSSSAAISADITAMAASISAWKQNMTNPVYTPSTPSIDVDSSSLAPVSNPPNTARSSGPSFLDSYYNNLTSAVTNASQQFFEMMHNGIETNINLLSASLDYEGPDAGAFTNDLIGLRDNAVTFSNWLANLVEK